MLCYVLDTQPFPQPQIVSYGEHNLGCEKCFFNLSEYFSETKTR